MALQFLHYTSIDEAGEPATLQPPTHNSRDTSTTSNRSTDSNPSSRRTSFGNFSVAALARQMTQKSSRSNSSTSSASTAAHSSASPAPAGKVHNSLADFEKENQLNMSSSSYQNDESSSSNGHSHENESLLQRVKESIPMIGSPNPNDPRKAFANRDVEASQRAHNIRMRNIEAGEPLEENHGNIANEYLKSIVYGGLDGIITTFATVTSVAGAHFSSVVVIVLGISHLFADGLSMGFGDALSTQAEIDYNHSERKREKWEMDNNMDGEIDEMVAIYIKKGISKADANTMIRTLAKYPDAFLDHMMVEELSLMPPDDDDSPAKDGMITMASFVLFGSVPLMPYLFALIPGMNKYMTEEVTLWSAVFLTVATLFALGALKSALVEAGAHAWWKGGLQIMVNGTIAAVVGWAVGAGLSAIVPEADIPGAG